MVCELWPMLALGEPSEAEQQEADDARLVHRLRDGNGNVIKVLLIRPLISSRTMLRYTCAMRVNTDISRKWNRGQRRFGRGASMPRSLKREASCHAAFSNLI